MIEPSVIQELKSKGELQHEIDFRMKRKCLGEIANERIEIFELVKINKQKFLVIVLQRVKVSCNVWEF